MDLGKSEESKSLLHIGVEFVNTSDSNNQGDFSLSWNIISSSGFSLRIKMKESTSRSAFTSAKVAS